MSLAVDALGPLMVAIIAAYMFKEGLNGFHFAGLLMLMGCMVCLTRNEELGYDPSEEPITPMYEAILMSIFPPVMFTAGLIMIKYYALKRRFNP